jgi:hypothetical protein
MHLRLYVLFQNRFAAGQNLLNVQAQLTRLRIDDLKFFFDPESEDVIFRTHRSYNLNPNGKEKKSADCCALSRGGLLARIQTGPAIVV